MEDNTHDTNQEVQDASVELTSKQIKYLKGLGHKLSPHVLVGKEGMSEQLIKAVSTELARHELVKVKIGTNSALSKNEAAEKMPSLTGSSFVQLIGKTIILFKPNPKLPKEKRIRLPKA